jgi:hypothetical protein
MTTVYEKARRDTLPWSKKLSPVWALFGNEDDGIYGDATWNPEGSTSFRTALLWWLRNPCHNLTWYVLGVADYNREVTGEYGSEFIAPGGGPLFCLTRLLSGSWLRKALPLPFLSYTSNYVKAYIGWRPSGAFGVKLNVSARGTIKF